MSEREIDMSLWKYCEFLIMGSICVLVPAVIFEIAQQTSLLRLLESAFR